MKKTVRTILYKTLTVFMAVLMASITAVQVFAGGRSDEKKTRRDIADGRLYIKDVIIVNESEKTNLKATAAYEDYVVLSDPIKTFDADSGHESLYFAVKTTEDPNEAITDIKAMNMNGDYDYDSYRQYLSEVEAWATKKAATTMTALEEFRANYAKGTPSATFAYNMLNYIIGDNDAPLGDFFVSDDYKGEHSIQVKNIVTKANLNSLTYFRQLLLIGCSETSADGSFVEKLRTHTKGNDLIPDPDNSKYNTAAEDLMGSMGTTREAVREYRKALSEHGDGLEDYLTETQKKCEAVISDEEKFLTDEYKKAKDETDTVSKIVSGQIMCSLFDEVYYTNKDGVQYSLSDILAKDPKATDAADVLTADMLLPVVALMSDGQRALCGCGFDKLVASVINDYSAEDSEVNGMLRTMTEYWQRISEEGLISIYAGVDMSLYDPNGIAMVGKSGEFLKKAESAYGAFGISDLAAGVMAGGAALGIVGSVALMKKGMATVMAQQEVIDNLTSKLNSVKSYLYTNYDQHIQEFIRDGDWSSVKYMKALRNEAVNPISLENAELDLLDAKEISATGQFMKALSYVTLAVSVILLVFSIVTFILNATVTPTPGKYLQVPRVLVTSIEKTEYDERQQKTTYTQMIFYKGIIDPFMSDEKAKANVSPSKVQDILDWSLDTKDREWIALYATKDGRVGNPILFNGDAETLITLVEKDGKTYSVLEGEKGFNGRVNIFNKDSYTACGDGVIVFNSDLDVTSTTKTGLGASMTIPNGYFILFILVAIMGGAGIGAGVTYLVNKNKKKKLAASQA